MGLEDGQVSFSAGRLVGGTELGVVSRCDCGPGKLGPGKASLGGQRVDDYGLCFQAGPFIA